MTQYIGFGGEDSSSSRTPVEDPNSLRQTQIAEIVDCLGEGECEGLVDGLKSVYLDGVPIENPNGSRNFTGVTFQHTNGSPSQGVMPGLDSVATEFGVDVEVFNDRGGVDGAIIRRVVKDTTDKVRVTLGFPVMTETNLENGDIRGSRVEFAIDVQQNNGGFVERYRTTVAGKTTSLYSRSIIVDIGNLAKPVDIRVRRLTADQATSNVMNSMRWMTYAEIQQVRLRYPNTCIQHLRFDAQQFSRIPSRSWDWKGLRVKVPTNYDPITRVYSGVWDGTFKIAWTDNPAWCIYAMITNPRWGLGSYVGEDLQNKWKLYEIARYCDELVPDGRGGTEPRFTCNLVIASREEAFNVLRDMAAIFRGMVYWGNSTVEYSQDAPGDAEFLYTPQNVIEGNFIYQDTSEREMHSVFICYWNDLTKNGKRTPEVYVDDELVRKYGVREIELALIGCTSQGQAARMGRWARYSEQLEGETIQFQVGSDGAVVAPGKVFKVADPNVAGVRLGGRIVSASTTEIELDDYVTLTDGVVYTLTVVRADPSNPFKTLTEERTVSTTVYGAPIKTLTVAPAFQEAPEAQLVWILQSSEVEATTWRCVSVKEIAGKCQFEISGVRHNPSKYDAVELGLKLDEPVVSGIAAQVPPPTDLQLVETVYTDGTVNKSRLTASWKPSRSGLRHAVRYRRDTTWWQEIAETSAQTVDIGPLEAGVYEVSVRSVNALGTYSEQTQGQITIAGGRPGIRAVKIKASANQFKVNTSGVALPATITLDADVGGLDGVVSWAVTSGTATLVPTGNQATLAYSDMTTETVVIRASLVQNGVTYSDALTIFKVRDGIAGVPGSPGTPGTPGSPGTPGTPATSGLLTLDVVALPADGSGNVTNYTGAFSSLMVFVGDQDDTTNGWSFQIVEGPDLDAQLLDNKVTITSVAAATDTSYVDVVASKAGYSSITKRVKVIKVKSGPKGDPGTSTPGERGSVTVSRAITGTTWSDAEAINALADFGYGYAVNLDTVTLFNIAEAFIETRVYSGGMWLTVQALINGNMIVQGTIGAQALHVDRLSSISADMGTVTAGLLESQVLVAGTLMGATGTFQGTLQAGVLNAAAFAPVVMGPYTQAGTYNISAPSTLPSGWSSIAMRYLIIGGGGSGGTTKSDVGSNGLNRLGAGGGFSATEKSGIINNVAAGTSLTLTVGAGGASIPTNTNGQYGNAGQATVLSGVDSADGGAGGVQYIDGSQPKKSDLNQIISVNYNQDSGRGGQSSVGVGGVQTQTWTGSNWFYNGAPGGNGAGGSGVFTSAGQSSGRGGDGYALIEFFDPNFVVTGNRYNNLIRWLDQRGFGAVPSDAR